MKYLLSLPLILILCLSCESENKKEEVPKPTSQHEWAVVIHGGAGGLRAESLSEEMKQQYLSSLQEVVQSSIDALKNGKTALDVVQEGIMLMEDNPIFNSGRGSVLNHMGVVEMDASIMDGSNLNAGAIAGSKKIKNPIKAARFVMDSTVHVLLSSDSGDLWAESIGLEMKDPSYFITERSKEILKSYQNRNLSIQVDENKGTVGMAVLDTYGNLAAGTSTGGMTNKQFGRIGDSPIIGSGTYANNNTCAVSCTGHGEKFIRLSIAHSLSAMLEYTDMTLQEAMDRIMSEKLASLSGDGGLIAVDKSGNIAMGFNTPSMLRAWANPDSTTVKIFE